MAGVIVAGLRRAEARGQIAAMARLRWQVFSHSLRGGRGSLELASRIFTTLMFGLGGLGGALGMAAGAWYFTLLGNADRLSALLWPVFFFWQFFPLATTAFSKTLDGSELLRFPLSYRGYFLMRLLYGSLDPATLVGGLWLLGITVGVGFARRSLLLWAAPVLLCFALLNVLLTQMIFAWIERWLAQRRTREIFGILFFLLIIGVQFIGPLVRRYGENSAPEAARAGRTIVLVQRVLPPGIATSAIFSASKSDFAASLGSLAWLGMYAVAISWLLNLRLRTQYRGENLSETAARGESRKNSQKSRLGWALPGLPAPVAAKNLAHLAVLALELVLVWTAVCLMFRPPTFAMAIATLAGVLFAAPVNLAAGNLLSIYSPKKIESGMLGRQRASQTTVLASFGIQLSTAGLCALALFLSRSWGNLWLATAALLVLAALAFAGYALLLNRMDRIAVGRRETLISELCRA